MWISSCCLFSRLLHPLYVCVPYISTINNKKKQHKINKKRNMSCCDSFFRLRSQSPSVFNRLHWPGNEALEAYVQDAMWPNHGVTYMVLRSQLWLYQDESMYTFYTGSTLVLAIPTGNLLSTVARGMTCLDFCLLHRIPVKGCPLRGGLQIQHGGKRVWKSRAWGLYGGASGGRRRTLGLIKPGATVTEGTGDRGGQGSTGKTSTVLVTVLPLSAAVML